MKMDVNLIFCEVFLTQNTVNILSRSATEVGGGGEGGGGVGPDIKFEGKIHQIREKPNM